MKCVGLVVLVLVSMVAIVAIKSVQNNKQVGVLGAVIGSAASASVVTGLYFAAYHILG